MGAFCVVALTYLTKLVLRMPSKDKRVRSISWFFRTALPTVEGICENPRDVVLGLFRDRKHYQSISLPGLDNVTFSVPAAASEGNYGNIVCGFIRGTGANVIAENAVQEWLPGPDSSEIHFEWTPIRGRFKKHPLITEFFSEIASNLTTRIDYIEAAPKPDKQMGRPRLMSHNSSIESNESGSASNQLMTMIDPSIQSLLPIGSSTTLLEQQTQRAPERDSSIDNSSTQEKHSSISLGSATSARGFQARLDLIAELKATRKEAENAKKAAAKKDEQLKELKAALRRLTRKKKSAVRGMTLTHSDGTTSRLHNVRNVFR